jgi:replicative DNA helicase
MVTDMSTTMKIYADDATEKCLLATITQSKSALNKAMVLESSDLYFEQNRIIFQAVQELYKAGAPVDMVAVRNKLAEKNVLEKVGGNRTISDIMRTGATIYVESCIERILENSRKRRLDSLAADVRDKVQLSPAHEISEYVEHSLKEINRSREDEFMYGRDLDKVDLDEWRLDEHSIGTGFTDLDGFLTGFYESQLVVIGARPSVGKSALALNIARRAAEKHGAVLYYSLEMPSRELVWRMVAIESNIDLSRLRAGILSEKEKDAAMIAVKKLAAVIPQLLINDSSFSISEIVRSARRASEHTKPALIVVDYLQLISGGKGERRYEQIGNISRSLKLLAMQLRVPVIALSQLNRASEQHAAPRLSDLRESGDIEQDSDVVLLLHRDDEHGEEHSIIIAKNRNGRTGNVGLLFRKSVMRFENMVQSWRM